MEKTISFIGGDYRIVKLIEIIKKDKIKIKTYGLEKSIEVQDNEKSKNIEESIENSNIVISSIPLSKDGIHLYMPFSDVNMELKDFFKAMYGKKLIAGNINDLIKEKYADYISKIFIYDFLKNETLTIANAIATAEGAIQIAMEETDKTIHSSNILILGFGRIGKILAKNLNALGATVTCEARKEVDIMWIKTYGYKALELKNIKKYLQSFDIIFNTIPHLILDKEHLEKVNSNCLIIDLASKPGGVDFDECDKFGIKCKWALALPGKVAPMTSAEYMKKYIYNIQ